VDIIFATQIFITQKTFSQNAGILAESFVLLGIFAVRK